MEHIFYQLDALPGAKCEATSAHLAQLSVSIHSHVDMEVAPDALFLRLDSDKRYRFAQTKACVPSGASTCMSWT